MGWESSLLNKTSILGVVTPDQASVESILAWSNRLQDRVGYVVVENATSALSDFTYWKVTEQSKRFREGLQVVCAMLKPESAPSISKREMRRNSLIIFSILHSQELASYSPPFDRVVE